MHYTVRIEVSASELYDGCEEMVIRAGEYYGDTIFRATVPSGLTHHVIAANLAVALHLARTQAEHADAADRGADGGGS